MLFKLIFYTLSVFSGLKVIYVSGLVWYEILKLPYTKLSEIVIMILGIIITLAGLYGGYRQVYFYNNYKNGSLIVGSALFIAFIVIIIGLLFFNGPIKWN